MFAKNFYADENKCFDGIRGNEKVENLLELRVKCGNL